MSAMRAAAASQYGRVMFGNTVLRVVLAGVSCAWPGGFVRHELAPKLGLREMPEIRFELDTSIERGARVEEILRKLRDGEPVADDEEEA